MSKELEIKNSERAIEVLKRAGFIYGGEGGLVAGVKESTKNGRFFPPTGNLMYNVAYLDQGRTLKLVNDDQPRFPDYHNKIKAELKKAKVIS